MKLNCFRTEPEGEGVAHACSDEVFGAQAKNAISAYQMSSLLLRVQGQKERYHLESVEEQQAKQSVLEVEE